MEKVLITYGDERYAHSRERLTEEARSLGIFDRVRAYTPDDLDDRMRHHPLMKYQRGGGYWVWKPWITLNALQQLHDGDVLVYVDSGCSLFPSKEWDVYFSKLDHNDMVVFSLATRCKQYTKRSVLDAFKPTLGPYWGEYYQLAGTVYFVHKTPFAMGFFSHMLDFCTEDNLIDVRPDEMAAQYPGFLEHRHDQALFTALVYENRQHMALLTNDFEGRHSGQAICATRIGDERGRYAVPEKTWLDVFVKRRIGNVTRGAQQAYWRLCNHLALRNG